jgi:hypothetical protein
MNLTNEQEKLAREIAVALDDLNSISIHRQFVQMYSEVHLRKQMQAALRVKDKDVLVSRGAIYTSLVKRNAGNFRN